MFLGLDFEYYNPLMQTFRLDLEKQTTSNGYLVVRLNGKLSLETVHNFIETMRPEPSQFLVVDMSGVSFMDSAGVGALVSLFVSRRNHGKSFAVAGLTQQGQAIFQVAGLTKLLPTFPTVDAALVGIA
jgi:anti-sigma B factor antagonist